MDLLERYLQAIGKYLPEATRDDTLAELRANLLEQMDARSEELGRPLADSDVTTILRAHGKPELVALRYLPQRSLIGPTIYPFYQYTVRKALPLVLFAYVVAHALPLITTPNAAHFKAILGSAALGLVPTLLLFFAIMTIVFAMFESGQRKYGAGASEWDPAKLPVVQHPGQKKERSLPSRVADLCVHCLWMVYVFLIPFHPYWIIGPGTYYLKILSASFAPVWHTFFVLVITLLSIQLVMKILALRNGPHPWKKPMEFLTGLLGATATGMLAFASVLLVPAGGNTNLSELAAVNYWMSRGFKIALFFVVIGLLVDAWKYVRPSIQTTRLAF
jgi:hypothetical protein